MVASEDVAESFREELGIIFEMNYTVAFVL